MILGALLSLAFISLLGAGRSETSKVDALQSRFLVLESTPVREAANGYQSHLLRVSPHYGKIDNESLKFRLANETQEIRMIVILSEGQSFNRGDIISFGSMHQQRLAAGSSVTRLLPGGGQEQIR